MVQTYGQKKIPCEKKYLAFPKYLEFELSDK